jgi:hypothetical protein
MIVSNLDLETFVKYKKIRDINHLITDNQVKQINNLKKFYNKKTIKNRLDSIRQFILCGVDKNWLSRLKIIQEKVKTDSISDFACKIRYGDKWKEKQNELKLKVVQTQQKYIEKYGEEIGTEKWNSLKQKRRSYGREIMIQRYGEELGVQKWEKTLQSKVQTMAERKKIKPYRNGRTLIEYQERYGANDGHLKWKERNEKQKYRFSVDYYKNTYNEQWETKWDEYVQSMSKTSLEKFILRYGEELGYIKYDLFMRKQIENLKVRPNYSKISQELFFNLVEELNCYENSYFAENKGEYVFYTNKGNKTYGDLKIIQVDFKYQNKIIEFDGDYWHSSKEQIEIDKLRDEYLREKGFKILRIKEGDFKNEKELTIIKCINFLKNE